MARKTKVEVGWPVAWLALLMIAGCGGEASIHSQTDAGGDGGAAAEDSGAEVSDLGPDPGDLSTGGDAGQRSDAGGDTGESPPVPESLSPCADVDSDCWETELGGVPCSSATHDEDFSSGNYNVHRYESFAWDGAPTTIELVSGSGAWEPALVVVETGGRTLFDGRTPLSTDELVIDVANSTKLTITSDIPLRLEVFVTSQRVLSSDFVDRISTDATYTLSITSECGGGRAACVVNGNDVREPACGWLHYVGHRVVPRLPGSREERIDTAAVVAWWALKEGVLFLRNPIVYSNCNFPDGDARIGPLDSCVDDRAWQVGLSGVQVPWHSDAEVEAAVGVAYPDQAIADVLASTAVEARLDRQSVEAVVNSTGTLRRSWLLRNSVVGFMIEEPVVRSECIDDSLRWCYGTGWDTTRLYAPDRASALRAIDDVKALLDDVAP